MTLLEYLGGPEGVNLHLKTEVFPRILGEEGLRIPSKATFFRLDSYARELASPAAVAGQRLPNYYARNRPVTIDWRIGCTWLPPNRPMMIYNDDDKVLHINTAWPSWLANIVMRKFLEVFDVKNIERFTDKPDFGTDVVLQVPGMGKDKIRTINEMPPGLTVRQRMNRLIDGMILRKHPQRFLRTTDELDQIMQDRLHLIGEGIIRPQSWAVTNDKINKQWDICKEELQKRGIVLPTEQGDYRVHISPAGEVTFTRHNGSSYVVGLDTEQSWV